MRKYHAPKAGVVRTRLAIAAPSKMASGVDAVPATCNGWFVPHTYTLADDHAYLRLDFYNLGFPNFTQPDAFTVDECAVEDVATGAVVQVTWAGATSLSLAAGDKHKLSDPIYPHKMSGMGQPIFPAGRVLKVRMRGSVAANSNFIRCTRTVGSLITFYDKATVTISPIVQAGNLQVTSGTTFSLSAGTYEPVLVGLRNSANSKACVMAVGDSLYDNYEPSFPMRTATANGYALLECSRGGREQADLTASTSWASYLQYVSVLIDDMGTNNSTDTTSYSTYWTIAKNTYGCDVYHTGLYPRALSSSDSFATLANQAAFPIWNPPTVEPFLDARVSDGTLKGQFRPSTIRDAATNKWAVDGTANKYTGDGTHPTTFADGLIQTEFNPVFLTWMSGRLAPTS
jgi:hypothetical protein